MLRQIFPATHPWGPRGVGAGIEGTEAHSAKAACPQSCGTSLGHHPHLVQDRGTHDSHPSQLQRGEEGEKEGHPERSRHGRATQRRQPAPGSQASGVEEHRAWLREEQPTLIWRQKPPGHLQFSMLPPLLPSLRAPGPALPHKRAAVPTASPLCQTLSLLPALQCPSPHTLVCSHETGMSHNSHHQLPLTCCGLESLSCFPSPKFGSAGVRRNLSSYSLRRAPERCHSSQGLPYKFYSQKSLKTTKENQFNPSKTSHIKSWQCTMLLCLPHFLSSTQGCCQHPLQTEAAVYCGIKPGCQEVAAPSATLRSLDNPLLPFFL